MLCKRLIIGVAGNTLVAGKHVWHHCRRRHKTSPNIAAAADDDINDKVKMRKFVKLSLPSPLCLIVPLCRCVKKLCVFASLRLCVKFFVFAFSADHSRSATESTSAADTQQPVAVVVSFQRHQPNLPHQICVDSALSRLLPACQFSGKYAICAINESTLFEVSKWILIQRGNKTRCTALNAVLSVSQE